MKKFTSTIHELFRENNAKVWAPMVISFAGSLLSPVIGLFLERSVGVLIVTIAIGLICTALYLLFVFKYIQHMHSIFEVLRSGKGLLKTCSYLAALRNNKHWNNYQLRSMAINYTFKEPVFLDNTVPIYPFSIEYIIQGQATTDMTNVVYHTIGSVHNIEGVSFEYAFDDEPYHAIERNNKLEVTEPLTFYKLVSCNRYRRNDIFTYKVRLSFDGKHGIKAKDLRRILFYCRNVTRNCDGVTAKVALSAPFSFETDFESPLFIQYVNGLNQVPNTSDLRLNWKKNYESGTQTFYTELPLDPDTLYVLELTGNHN